MAISNKEKKSGYGLNNWIGWGLTTLALFFLNKKNSSSSTSSEPADLSITSTKLGGVIPVVMGTSMVKSPLISYWGDFRADIYTEEYGMHSALNVWPMLVQTILMLLPLIEKPGTAAMTEMSGYPLHAHSLNQVQIAEMEDAKKRGIIVTAIVNFLYGFLTTMRAALQFRKALNITLAISR